MFLALSLQRRTVIPGQIPTNASLGGGPASSTPGWELRRGHQLHSSVGLHTPFPTACGRTFNPQLYYEVLQACCDQHWLQAIQRELRSDTEWMETLSREGGVAKTMNALTESTYHDDEFMMKMQDILETDKKMSLRLCAIQEGYERIRNERDMHETQVAADGGNDPYATMRKKQQ
ncbi:putative complement regulatory protein [Trypanosoma rangeli]|uniref:Putative complement regulatory protein n=1 Tax=Trypanosoma rangeli TaxID=5698 RepID=A0A422NWZ6_TRYRA|nr:putative complement regulatory protein [Trypanosoma rangeli]RNF10042.1 putative complement regulatory protein [Trypanosoma rangeli]|eukprot:RNF10042.1 putative complement regulatory protein [Trypanosoma rangeli]